VKPKEKIFLTQPQARKHKLLLQPHLDRALGKRGTTHFTLFKDSPASEIATQEVSDSQNKKNPPDVGRASTPAEAP